MANAKLQELYEIAQGQVGYDRYKDPAEGTRYGRWYAEKVGNSYYAKSGVPYCAMFVSWCASQAQVSFPGLPSAYCPDIHKSQNVNKKDLQFMDLVLFDFEEDGEDDHVGFFVEWEVPGTYAKTIEGNTQNGKVCNRTRYISTICGGVRSDTGNIISTIKSNVVAVGSGNVSFDNLAIDGIEGQLTIKALQRFLNKNGASLEVDGIKGKLTVKALQTFLNNNL